ncbi:hypothetical protein ACJ73_05779 [Blastomyces percursus]|uniref:Uncharacterized protein n=1 Tax=Blastomyces percursus TaxID=1658174 RepID=A0A1J9QRN5_9EURO|nr:hypothetical protein ACJ73_05779 [Blastomyces percursus]
MTPSLPEHAAAREIPGRGRLHQVPRLWTDFYHDLSARAFLALPMTNLDRHRTTRLIWMIERMKNTTRNLSEDREASHLGGDAKGECDSETGDGRNSEAMSIRDLEGESQTQPQSGPRPTGPPQPVPEPEPKAVTDVLTALAATRRMLNHCRHGPSPAHCQITSPRTDPRRKPMPESAALLHPTLNQTQAAPISCYISEDDIAKVHPDQLKRYKERLDVGPAKRASQARKRARSPFPEPRRSSRQKKPRQC